MFLLFSARRRTDWLLKFAENVKSQYPNVVTMINMDII